MFNRRILKYLENWKDRSGRKPLILRGARQVGKTASVKIFAQKFFKETIFLNLEDSEHKKLFGEEISLEDFEKIIQIKFGKTLEDGKTLLFIDEIQNSPALIKLLRFFYEERPALHVIAAGSLLEVKLIRGGFSFPVGRVEYAYLHPLDFFEFLEAKGEKELCQHLRNLTFKKPLPAALHAFALKHFYEYLMIGGMPEAVKVFVAEKDFSAVNRVYNSLFTAYMDDVHKYASEAKSKYVAHVIENAPLFSGQTITYEHFAGSLYRSREMVEAFETLEKAMLVYRVMGTNDFAPPLIPKRKKAPKLLFLDVGLINYRLGVRDKMLGPVELNNLFKGKIAEQVVGQHLLSMAEEMPSQVYYWYREMPGSTAEVDFIINCAGNIVPIEVKSGAAGRLRSAKEFVAKSGARQVIRVCNRPLSNEEIKIENIRFNLLSIPFYLLPRLKDIPTSCF